MEREKVAPSGILDAAPGLIAALAFVAFAFTPFMGKAFHMDEPLFLAPARHILKDPFHPLAFNFNWYGQKVPMSSVNNTPPLFLYLLAIAWKTTGGKEFPMRLFFLPFDLLSAGAIYLLARKFLKRPLLPALAVLASPGYLLGFNLLYPDKPAAAFGFLGLYAWVRGMDADASRGQAWKTAAGASLALALLSKYAAVIFLIPAATYALSRKISVKDVIGLAASALFPLGLYLALNASHGGGAFSSAWRTTVESLRGRSWLGTARAVPAFIGGCAGAAAIWPLLAIRSRRSLWLATACAALSVILFFPHWGLGTARPADRGLGAAFSFCAVYGIAVIAAERGRTKSIALFGPWILAVLFLECIAYWSVIGRIIALLIAPVIFIWAEILERRFSARALYWIYGISLAATIALSLSLAWVDSCYADAQKTVAETVFNRFPGRKIWTSSHWGLQYYVEKNGGREIDLSRGGWSAASAGDVALLSLVNSNQTRPGRAILADAQIIPWQNPLPLRLMSAGRGEAGFYSSVFGFLPYDLGRAAIDEFAILKIR
ncbi:MAG: glycosyltransferase family 39 protein [Elusimicrobiota bacterium]